jgi:hypothetical protein
VLNDVEINFVRGYGIKFVSNYGIVGLIIPGNLELAVKFEIVFAMSELMLKKFGFYISNCYENILYKF